MNAYSYCNTKAFLRERLHQVVASMEGLSERQRAKNFDINCFVTDDADSAVSAALNTFFGSAKQLLATKYCLPRPVTVNDAISAFNRVIDELTEDVSVPSP